MKLTASDKQSLLDFGVPEADFSQVELAMNVTTYEIQVDEDSWKKISRKALLERMERREWLSGLDRSAFHASALRFTRAGEEVIFDSSKIWR